MVFLFNADKGKETGSTEEEKREKDDSDHLAAKTRQTTEPFSRQFILFSLLLLLSAGQIAEAADAEGKSINRINYGVFFDYVGQIMPTTNILRHTFKVALPLKRSSDEMEFMKHMDIMNQRQLPCLTEMGNEGMEIHPVCKRFMRNIDFLLELANDGSKQMHRLVNDIYDLVPLTTKSKQKLEKRAILGFVGQLMNSVFGTANQDDIDTLNTNVLKLTETVNTELKVIKKTVTDLSDFAEKTTNRLNDLVQEVKDNSIQNLKLIQAAVYNEDKIIDFLSNLTLSSMKVKHLTDTLIIHYTNFLTGMQILLEGRLSMYLIPKEVLSDTLQAIQEDLKNSEIGKNFQVIYTKPDFYYRKGAFVLGRNQENLYITLQVPVTSVQSKFLLYRLTYNNLHMHDSNKHSIQLEDHIYGLAISETKDLFYELSEYELYELHTASQFEHSRQRTIFKTAKQKPCLIAIYLDDKVAVNSTCKYVIAMHNLKSEITHLHDNIYLLTNISEIAYNCADEQEVVQKGCDTCVVTLKHQCSMKANSFFIPETLQGKFEENQGIKYIAQLPLLMHFFTNDTLKNINGFTTFLEKPKLDLPDFHFYENNITKTFSGDLKQNVYLEKVAQSVKNDKEIVTNLGEAIILGKITASNSFWTSTPGIVMMVTTGVVTLLILSNLYLLNKLRYLIITVGVLKCTATKVSGEGLQLQYEKPTIFDSQNDKTMQQIFTEIAREINYNHVALILSLTLLLIIIYNIYKKLHKTRKLGFDFMLEFSSKQAYCYVKILTLQGPWENYTIGATEFINNIKIEGIINSALTFHWANLKLIDQSTTKIIEIKKKAPLSWKEGQILKEIFAGQFLVNPVFVFKDGNIKRIQMEKQEEQPNKIKTENVTIDI